MINELLYGCYYIAREMLSKRLTGNLAKIDCDTERKNVMNNTPVTPPEFGIYKISISYLCFIRKTNPAVMDPDITNVYCGPVRRSETNRGPVDYFVPVDIEKYKKNSFFLMDFSDGILAGIMDFKRTIPCLPDEYEFDTSNPKLSEFCHSCKTQILECAAILAEIQAKKET